MRPQLEKVISGAARFEESRWLDRPVQPARAPSALGTGVRAGPQDLPSGSGMLNRGLHGEISLSGEAGRPAALPPGPPPARILLLRGKGEPFPSRSACCCTERVHSLARGLLLQIPPLTPPAGHRHLPTSAARAAVEAANPRIQRIYAVSISLPTAPFPRPRPLRGRLHLRALSFSPSASCRAVGASFFRTPPSRCLSSPFPVSPPTDRHVPVLLVLARAASLARRRPGRAHAAAPLGGDDQ